MAYIAKYKVYHQIIIALLRRACHYKENKGTTSAHMYWQGRGDQDNTHAMPAACNVDIKPAIIALKPMRAMTRVRDGASADSTPI